jgi:hypothetical protein
VKGVGDGGGQLGSGAEEGRSLLADYLVGLLRSIRPKGGQHDTSTAEDCRDGKNGVRTVARELEQAGPSLLSNADRPRPVGTPVR